MSIKLYTPATGFPDLEVKIAYGIARIGLEALGEKRNDAFLIRNLGGYYEIEFFIDENEFKTLDDTLNFVLRKLFSSFYIQNRTPGVTSKSKSNVTVNLGETYSLNLYRKTFHKLVNEKSENICKHEYTSIGNIIGFSSFTSFHNSRDDIDVDKKKGKNSEDVYFQRPTNPKKICKLCGMMALLGIWFASFIMNYEDGKEVFIVPIPRQDVWSSDINKVFSMHHIVRKSYISVGVPERVLPLVFFSQLPSSAGILEKFDLFLTVLSRPGGQGYHVDGVYTAPTSNYVEFINYSPFNVAAVDIILRSNKNPASLPYLHNAIFYKDKRSAQLFARQYVLETSSKNRINLLFPATADYLLRRVFMIKEEILKSKAVRSVAKTLGYFLWHGSYQNYSYADGIRNARSEKEVRDILQKLMREAKLRYDQESKKEEGKAPNVPSAEDIEELNRLMTGGKENFDQVKAALYLLAFSYESHKKII